MNEEEKKRILLGILRNYERATTVYDKGEYIICINNIVLLLAELTVAELKPVEQKVTK